MCLKSRIYLPPIYHLIINFPSTYSSIYLSVCLSSIYYLSFYLSTYLSLPIFLSIYNLSTICLSIYLLSVYLPTIYHLSSYLISYIYPSITYLTKAEFIHPPIPHAYLYMWIVGNCSQMCPFSTFISESKYIIISNFWWHCVEST